MSINVFDWHAHYLGVLEDHERQVEQYEKRIADLEFALMLQREVNTDLRLKLRAAKWQANPTELPPDPKCPF